MLAVLVLLAPAAVVGMVRAQSSPNSSACTDHRTVTVLAAPEIAPAIQRAGSSWARTAHPGGTCPTIKVTSATPYTAVAQLKKASSSTLPDVWIPDSSLWLQRLRADIAGNDAAAQSAWVSPSLASSPLVMAVPPTDAADVTKAAAGGWTGLLSSDRQVGIVDPTRTTEGLLTLVQAQAVLGGNSSVPTQKLISSLLGLHGNVLSTPAEGLDQLRGSSAVSFPASEQDVIASNAGNTDVQAIYPRGRAVALDFPVVQFAPPVQAFETRDAVTAFVRSLYDARAQQRIRAVGLRDAAGRAFASTVDFRGVAPTASIATLRLPDDDRVADASRVWLAAGRGTRTLLVIDVSGSMAQNGKMRFAAGAASDVVDFLPDDAELGLWVFSTDLTGSLPYRQVVSLGPLRDPLSGTTRRLFLRSKAAGLASTDGDTGLYRTTLAAFDAVRSGYQTGKANSVVLLTDGSDTESSLSLKTLLAKLKAAKSSSKPIPIDTIAVGPDADAQTLKQISAVTGGTERTATSADDIRNLFLNAVVEAGK